jgi:hypothetical protein
MKKFYFAICCLTCAVGGFAQKQAVLTTPASATPDIVAFKANATYVGGEPVGNSIEYKINFTGMVFDESKNFSIATDEFTAPVDGIYHFDLRVSWLQFTAPGLITLNIKTNNYIMSGTTVQVPSVSQSVFDSNFSLLSKLKAGEKVSVNIVQRSGAQQKYQQVQFSGFKTN